MKNHNILVIHAHTENRGDEAAVKAMIAAIKEKEPDANICISYNGPTFYPNMDNVKEICRFPKIASRLAQLDFFLILMTKGKLSVTKEGREFINEVKKADIVLHAPGGPSIGDIYEESEWLYLKRLQLIKRMGIPYMFYAPSMGPFKNEKRNKHRKAILRDAEKIVLRDPISLKYVNEFLGEDKAVLALDSAFQNNIDGDVYEKLYDGYTELKDFMAKHEKCIGITITDLLWHPKHRNNKELLSKIEKSFKENIEKLTSEGYGIVFIPQLYGILDDEKLMNGYCINDNCFTITSKSEKYDSQFQQYVISKLYAVIGMRYHSNIFSAKQLTPFISITYEQKMLGFMKESGLEEYCIDVNELNADILWKKFNHLVENYDEYVGKLKQLKTVLQNKAHITTDELFKTLETLR